MTGTPAPALTIELSLDRGRIRPGLSLAAGPAPARLLVGRRPAEAAALVPLVFNLCAAAQARAARGALGLDDIDDDATLRLEHLRDHALCFAAAWPAALGEGPDNRLLSLVAAHCGDGGPATADRLRLHLVGSAADDLAGLDDRGLERLLNRGATPVTRLLATVRRRLSPPWGRAALPSPTAGDIAGVLGGDAPRPLRETTALDHVADAPLIAALDRNEGRSLFLRMVARLVDCLRCLDPAALFRRHPTPAPGIGIAGAVRGLLGHGARLDEQGRVAAYRLVTPTDWNLAPGGVLEQALGALPAGGDLPFLARIAVSCINPCVPTSLIVDGRRFATHA